MLNKISPASQDYLKTIYKLTEQNGRSATTSQIADTLNLAPASVTNMVKKLAKDGLLTYKKHQGVQLTENGRLAALELMRHHRLLELFLHEKLGYAWDEVHEEAERLEHVISEQLEARIAAALGHPQRDPHGQRIPSAALTLAPSTAFPLRDLTAGQTAVIRRVNDHDDALLRHLASLNLRPNTTITVQKTIPFDRTHHLLVQGQDELITIGEAISRHIFVDLIKT